MKRSVFVQILVPAIMLLALAVLFSGCGKKVQIVDEKGNDIHTGQSAQSDATGATSGGSNAFSQFREEHKYTFQLSRFAGNIGRLEKDQKAPLTQEQAKAVLAVLQPLRTQTSLTQDQAKEALRGLKTALTEEQLTQIGTMKAPKNGMRAQGGMQGGQGGNSAGGQGGGQQGNRPRTQFNPAAMKDFNPFNPPKDSPMARGAARMEELFTLLEAKANGQSAPAPGATGGHMHHHHGGAAGGGNAPDNNNAPAPQ